MLSAKRDVSAVKRFFKKMMRAEHRRPRSQSASIRTRRTRKPSAPHKMSALCRRTAVSGA
jgi:transposase-like protein